VRTHWLTRPRTDDQHIVSAGNEAFTGIKAFSYAGAVKLGHLSPIIPAREGVLQFDDSIVGHLDPEFANLVTPIIPGTLIYPEQVGAGGDYVPEGSPFSDIMAVAQPAGGAGRGPAAVARYFEGDIFTNGALHMVYESAFERTPLQTIWGNAFLRTPNTFNPLHPPIANYANVVTNGIGGWITGQMALQPLESEE
jgi:hypothetical protein